VDEVPEVGGVVAVLVLVLVVVGVVDVELVVVVVLLVVGVGVLFVVDVEELVDELDVVELDEQSFAASVLTVVASCDRPSRKVELTVDGRLCTSLLNESTAFLAASQFPLRTAAWTLSSLPWRLPA
jgi:UDP-N-acetylmuramyl pentapeptide phosphotransferase/UDP-N-acetylglucosamine-1-phosphate transferase